MYHNCSWPLISSTSQTPGCLAQFQKVRMNGFLELGLFTNGWKQNAWKLLLEMWATSKSLDQRLYSKKISAISTELELNYWLLMSLHIWTTLQDCLNQAYPRSAPQLSPQISCQTAPPTSNSLRESQNKVHRRSAPQLSMLIIIDH